MSDRHHIACSSPACLTLLELSALTPASVGDPTVLSPGKHLAEDAVMAPRELFHDEAACGRHRHQAPILTFTSR
jgi:hypothetical protein